MACWSPCWHEHRAELKVNANGSPEDEERAAMRATFQQYPVVPHLYVCVCVSLSLPLSLSLSLSLYLSIYLSISLSFSLLHSLCWLQNYELKDPGGENPKWPIPHKKKDNANVVQTAEQLAMGKIVRACIMIMTMIVTSRLSTRRSFVVALRG